MTYSRRATPASTDFSFRSPFKSLPQHAQLWKNAEHDELALLPRAARVAPLALELRALCYDPASTSYCELTHIVSGGMGPALFVPISAANCRH